MAVDRSDLVALIDQMVRVGGGDQVPAERPVLLIEGSAGSGRSSVLRAVRDRWADQAPTAWVDPLQVGDANGQDMRPVLLAVILGLSGEVTGYRLRFPRVLAAYVAMTQPDGQVDPERTVEDLRAALNHYRDRDHLVGLISTLVHLAGHAAQVVQWPGGDVVAALGDEAAPRIADRLRRTKRLTKWNWGAAVEWFRHQDRGLNWDPIQVLARLGVQAKIQGDAVRREVDDLLISALLADLRESLVGLANRPANAVILLDNGDAPMAEAFTTALVRCRNRTSDALTGSQPLPPDPLAVVTVSGGRLIQGLAGPGAVVRYWEGGGVPGTGAAHQPRAWLPVRLADFSEREVTTLAGQRMWPPEFGSGAVGQLVHRLTGGHARATTLVLRALDGDPSQLDDLGKVLRLNEIAGRQSLEAHLLDDVVAELRPSGRIDRLLREDLITLSAARDENEATALAALLQSPSRQLLFASTALWSGSGPRLLPPLVRPNDGAAALPPLIRYLALRRLAVRDAGTGATWDEAFGTLREAVPGTDVAGRLHHELALGNLALVAGELAELLPVTFDEDWLALLDQVTGTPDPRSVVALPKNARIEFAEWAGVVTRIVEGQHAAADPQLSDRDVLHYLYSRLSNDFSHIANTSRVFLARAGHFAELAKLVG